MRRRIVLLTLALVAAACGGASGDAGGQQDGDRAVVDTADTDLQEIVVDVSGMTLYVFDQDTGGETTCYDSCAAMWPPFLTEGEPQAQGSADASLLGTTEREDGSLHVTYDGRPLYYYAADSAPGDTSGQGFGGIWWAIAPDGSAVTGSTGEAEDPGRSSGGYDY